MSKKELIIGYEHLGVLPEKPIENRAAKIFPVWPNGWPTEEQEVNNFLLENHAKGNGEMVWGCKTKQDVVENLVFNCDSPLVEPMMFNSAGEIPGIAKLKSVYDIRDEKYIFPFAIHGSAFFQLPYFNHTGLQLSEKVKEDCRKGLCKIFMHEFLEGHGFNLTWIRMFITKQCELLSIPLNSFVFADSSYLTPALQATYGTKGFYKFWWERHPGTLTDEQYNRRVHDLKNPSTKPYYFLCLNRRFRWHRTKIILEIFKRWNDKFLWSHDRPNIKEELFNNPDGQHFSFEDLLVKTKDFPKELYDILPKRIDIEHTVNDTAVRLELQEQAYINVVTETMFTEPDTLFFSEKVYKPIVALQPFILLGSYQSLKVLHEQGYKTFHPIINEEYDELKNPDERFNAIVMEIDRLSNLSHEEMHNLIKECADICIYNYQHWKRLNQNRSSLIRDIEFLEEIRDWLYAD
jgi:hypothetical protein